MSKQQSFDELFERAKAAVQVAESGHADVEARGTCQACLEAFVVKPSREAKGKMGMVKHGFKRPGLGYLIGECVGVGHPPFELDCELTKKWRQQLIDVMLPRERKNLKDLESGAIKQFAFEVRIPGMKSWEKNSKKTIWLTEGQEPYEGWTESYPPNFAYKRKIATEQTKDNVKNLESEIAWLGKRIAEWKYNPQALQPKEKALTEAQTIRRWFETSSAELSKLPSPKNDGKTFLQWAQNFPHTLAWVSMKGHRLPRYYEAIRSQYEKMTGAKPLEVARPKRSSEVLNREEAERLAAREAKQAERDAKKQAKETRATQTADKAGADIERIQKKFNAVITNPQIIEGLGKPVQQTWRDGKAVDIPMYDYFIELLQRYDLVEFIRGKMDLGELIDIWKAKKRLYGEAPTVKIRRELREQYEHWRIAANSYTGVKVKAL